MEVEVGEPSLLACACARGSLMEGVLDSDHQAALASCVEEVAWRQQEEAESGMASYKVEAWPQQEEAELVMASYKVVV